MAVSRMQSGSRARGGQPADTGSASPVPAPTGSGSVTATEPRATVNGQPVREFRALISPSFPAAFITLDGGTETISRVYYDERGIDLGHGIDRAVCARKPVALHYDTTLGLRVEMTDRWSIWIPAVALQACWQTL